MGLRHSRTLATFCAAAFLVVGVTSCNTRFGASMDRGPDPVVLTGVDTPNLIGADPQHVVGFAWDGTTWTQIPVQVDERDMVSPGVIYHWPTDKYPKLKGTQTPYEMLVYTPPANPAAEYTVFPTYTPVDSDPTVDANDEISFMAYDTGSIAPEEVAPPADVDGSSRQEITVTDPLDPSALGTVYLFTSSTLTGGSAGTTGVNYTFSLTRGDYKATYRMGSAQGGPAAMAPNNQTGPNPETSVVEAPMYQLGFSDRWVNNSMRINDHSASGEMLDRTNYLATGVGCLRTEDTFSGIQGGASPGAFIANISGPVRAIRSYMGANSFTYTNVTDVFYPTREDTTVHLIGHAGLPGFAAGTDMFTGAAGMTYSDAANTGLTIDGVPDAHTPLSATTGSGSLPPAWQMVKGPSGTVISTRTLDTSLNGLEMKSTYADLSPSDPAPCTGDSSSWGYHGYEINAATGGIPVTDPTISATADTFVTTGYRYFAAANFLVTNAPGLEERIKHPLVATGDQPMAE